MTLEPARLVLKAYQAFGAQDVATLRQLIHKDAEFTGGGAGVLKGHYMGIHAILGAFGQIFEETKGTFNIEILETLGTGSNLYVRQRIAGERNGNKLHAHEVLVFTLEEGTIRKVDVFVRDMKDFNTFWS